MTSTKRRHRLSLIACMLLVTPAASAAAPPPPADILLPPGAVVIVSVDNHAWLIYGPVDGSAPVVAAAFRFGGEVPVPIPQDPTPPPGTVTGVMIVENQEDRTAAQATVMDDPTWQAAAKAAGLTWAIEDRDGKQAAPMLGAITIPLPVVVWVGEDGKPVAVVPLPATVEEMRTLIGGAK